MDTVEVYEMMNGMCETEGVQEFNLQGMKIKHQRFAPGRGKKNEIS